MDLRQKRMNFFGKTTKKLIQMTLHTAIGFLLASGRMFGEYSPLGLGFVAAGAQGVFGYAGIFGVALGYLCTLYRANGLKYLAIVTLILTERVVFREQGFRKPWIMPAAAALATALLGFVFLIDGGVQFDECVFFGTEVLLVFGSTWLFATARTREFEQFPPLQKQSFFFCLLATLIFPLTRVEAVSLSLGRILSYASVMTVGWFGSTAGAQIAAVIFGVTCGSVYPAVYGVSALVGAGLKRRGALAFLCGHLAVALLGMLLVRRSGLGLEGVASSLIFTVLRLRFSPMLSELFSEHDLKKSASLRAAAKAFSDLHTMLLRFLSKPRRGENIAGVFSRPARVVCKDCTRRDTCWKTELSETKTALETASDAMRNTHELKADDLPLDFAAQCLHIGEFLSETNRELAIWFCRKEYNTRLREAKVRLCTNFRDMSRVLAGIAEERSVKPQVLRAELGVAKKRKAGNSVCGDTVGHCRTPNGTVCVLLADGMGTGDAAARESRLAVDLLIRFLESGVDPQSALAVVSAALQMKCEETNAFTTLDLLCVDLTDGVCTLYRFGSAPAYFRTHGKVECITCTSMPLGLSCEEAPSVDRVTRNLDVNDEVILMSDGVSDEIRPTWLMQTLQEHAGRTPQELAKEILAGSQSSDDRTVLVLRICEEEESW